MSTLNQPSASTVIDRLIELYHRDGWVTKRRHPFGITFRERCSCYPLTVLLILQHCDVWQTDLAQISQEIIADLSRFRQRHLTYYWPLKDGQPTFFHSAILGKALNMSPDADDSCLHQLVDPQPQFHDDLAEKLAECRVGTGQFVFSPAQKRRLPQADGSFMTWLPPPLAEGKYQLETVDLGVDGVVLSFLKSINRYDIPGVAETENAIRLTLDSDLILRDPFVVSPYYPNSATILYLLARAIVWGKLEGLSGSLDRIRMLARSITPRNTLDILCLTSVGLLLDDAVLAQYIASLDISEGMKVDPYFIGHFGLGTFSWTFDLVRLPLMQFQSSSEALQWAMLLWIVENS